MIPIPGLGEAKALLRIPTDLHLSDETVEPIANRMNHY